MCLMAHKTTEIVIAMSSNEDTDNEVRQYDKNIDTPSTSKDLSKARETPKMISNCVKNIVSHKIQNTDNT
jgi:hypothetical protein